MATTEGYSKDLWNTAKWFYQQSVDNSNKRQKQAMFRSSIFHAFAFLESQVVMIGEHFRMSPIMSQHEKAMLLELNVTFRSGGFHMTSNTKFYKLEEKMALLGRIFSDKRLTDETWWTELKNSITIRNSLAHPKEDAELTKFQVKRVLEAVINCVASLYKYVFNKNLPIANLGIESTWE